MSSTLPEGFEHIPRETIPYVRWETWYIEDREETLRGGTKQKPVDVAIVTPPGSRDELPRYVDDWFAHLAVLGRKEQSAKRRLQILQAQYASYKAGQEIPTVGTPIRTCPAFLPGEVQEILSANIRTLEDLVEAAHDAKRRIGPSASRYIERAKAYLDAAKGPSALANQFLGLKGENAALQAQLHEMKQVQEQMMERINSQREQPPGQNLGQAKRAYHRKHVATENSPKDLPQVAD